MAQIRDTYKALYIGWHSTVKNQVDEFRIPGKANWHDHDVLYYLFFRATDGICTSLAATHFGAPHEEKAAHFHG
jgi:hypothetical protein